MQSDQDLLKRFEPVLLFAGGDEHPERFLPIDVETYLEFCTLWRSYPALLSWLLHPVDVTKGWYAAAQAYAPGQPVKGEALAAVLDQFDKRHFLRHLPEDEEKSVEEVEKERSLKEGINVAMGCYLVPAVLLAALTWWASSQGIKWLAYAAGAITLAIGLLEIVFLLISRFSDDKAQVGFGLLFSAMFAGGAVWSSSAGVGWLAWILGSLAAFFLLGTLANLMDSLLSKVGAGFLTSVLGLVMLFGCCLVVTLSANLDQWLTPLFALGGIALLALLVFSGEQGLAAVMEITSPIRRQEADRLEGLYKKMLGESRRPARYYGRVYRDPSEPGRVALQYHLFYSFNDWRYHNGFNFHEGDWEAVFVYLRQLPNGACEPDQVGLSQHHEGVSRPWGEVERKGDHPCIYVAAGSHANYFKQETKTLDTLFKPGPAQRFIAWRDKVKRDADRRARQPAPLAPRFLGGRERAEEPEAERPSPVMDVSEYPNGLGMVMGPEALQGAYSEKRWQSWPDRPVLLDSAGSPAWVQFRGLWGLKSILKDESGPPGPQWDRPAGALGRAWARLLGKQIFPSRLTWRRPYEWLERTKEGREREEPQLAG